MQMLLAIPSCSRQLSWSDAKAEEAVLIPLIKSGNSFLSISAREIFCLAQTAAA